MNFTIDMRETLIKEIKDCLSSEHEITKIIIFGSFLRTEDPKDIDIAIFQDSDESYLALAMKYRKLTRKIAQKIPLDLVPVKHNVIDNWFLSEINSGDLIYEK